MHVAASMRFLRPTRRVWTAFAALMAAILLFPLILYTSAPDRYHQTIGLLPLSGVALLERPLPRFADAIGWTPSLEGLVLLVLVFEVVVLALTCYVASAAIAHALPRRTGATN